MDLSTNVSFPPSSPPRTVLSFAAPRTISPTGAGASYDDYNKTYKNGCGYRGTNEEKERPFKCLEPGCYQSFKRKFSLIEHTKTHTGERPFTCPVVSCGKTFATSGNLTRHKRLHPWLKPQVCLVAGCSRSFTNEAKLERHLKTHFKSKGSRAADSQSSTYEARVLDISEGDSDDAIDGNVRKACNGGGENVQLQRASCSTTRLAYEPLAFAVGDSTAIDADLLEFLECLF